MMLSGQWEILLIQTFGLTEPAVGQGSKKLYIMLTISKARTGDGIRGVRRGQ